jgi:hypothetical protein
MRLLPEDAELRRAFLAQRQSLPLEAKERLSLTRIRRWQAESDGRCYVAFSGGLDLIGYLILRRVARTLTRERATGR